jgi:caa(3)-type oxidase subunit IV
MSDHSIETTAGDAGHGSHGDIDRQVRIYILVFVSLMVLTLVTVAVSRQHLPVGQAVAVALIVASIKGSLVACYFMHLISEKKLIYWVLAFTVAFFFAVLLLPMWTQADHIQDLVK